MLQVIGDLARLGAGGPTQWNALWAVVWVAVAQRLALTPPPSLVDALSSSCAAQDEVARTREALAQLNREPVTESRAHRHLRRAAQAALQLHFENATDRRSVGVYSDAVASNLRFALAEASASTDTAWLADVIRTVVPAVSRNAHTVLTDRLVEETLGG